MPASEVQVRQLMIEQNNSAVLPGAVQLPRRNTGGKTMLRQSHSTFQLNKDPTVVADLLINVTTFFSENYIERSSKTPTSQMQSTMVVMISNWNLAIHDTC